MLYMALPLYHLELYKVRYQVPPAIPGKKLG